MPISRAEIATESGAKLINRLCKHWAHKLDVEQSDGQARVAFEEGTCLMQATNGQLTIALEALDDESLDHLESVVHSHLERMAGKDELDIVWET
ncbi:DUF2218 domain-containing protein [Litchfieldella rifensis]|uniref:DUF2218 domain-containing protein n=1 Tax=Litchfieldella rifensis TaxID=762643 RepID=A0ABV7LTI3_9GAMM